MDLLKLLCRDYVQNFMRSGFEPAGPACPVPEGLDIFSLVQLAEFQSDNDCFAQSFLGLRVVSAFRCICAP